jgi:hypothetical protein
MLLIFLIFCIVLWFVCLRPVYSMLQVSLDCQLLTAPSVFSNVYFLNQRPLIEIGAVIAIWYISTHCITDIDITITHFVMWPICVSLHIVLLFSRRTLLQNLNLSEMHFKLTFLRIYSQFTVILLSLFPPLTIVMGFQQSDCRSGIHIV